MLFNSLTYLVFLPAVVGLYWLLPQRARLWLILASSLTFYGFWRLDFIPLILFSAALDYGLGLLIERTEDQARRRRLMIGSITANLLILGVFKYLIFFTETARSIAGLVGYQPSWPELNIILPLGVSFYIFSTISYIVDVYRRDIPAEKNPLVYFCFVTFFPHLVAGPILRAGVLIPQLIRPAAFRWTLVARGVRRILAGLFLKVCLADNIAPLVDLAFAGDVTTRTGLDAWTMAFLFGLQIYFDFSAYSHIAIGSALLMGVFLPENFNFPYFAASPRDFWKRWHISLSTWVRDYLYVPLMGGAPKGAGWETLPDRPIEKGGRRTTALFVSWGLMGLWHGANWTFAVWGLYHAFCIWLQRRLGALWRPPAVVGWLVTLPLMMAAWIPFRTTDLGQAFTLWSRMLDLRAYGGLTLWSNSYPAAAVLLAGMAVVFAGHKLVLPKLEASPRMRIAAETLFFAVVGAGVIVYLQVRDQFIYFQF